MAAFLFSAIAIASFKLLYMKEDRYVIAGKLYLRNSKSAEGNDNTIKVLDFGSMVEVIDADNNTSEDGLVWAKVRDNSGKEGYVAMNYLGNRRELEQYRGIFLAGSQEATPVLFKRAIHQYYIKNGLFDGDRNPQWRINAEDGSSSYNAFAKGDFNNDGMEDYACLLSNKLYDGWRLQVYLAKGPVETSLVLDEELYGDGKLAIMKKGQKISTGRTKYVMEYDEEGNVVQTPKKIYEPLESDALILKNADGGKRMLYVFDLKSGLFNQPIVMK
jgi:hypothetical protein